jgi:hypothetical protein
MRRAWVDRGEEFDGAVVKKYGAKSMLASEGKTALLRRSPHRHRARRGRLRVTYARPRTGW